MYAREIEDRTYTFGVSGKLIRNVLVMYDQQTESYWSQLIGEAVEGPMKGTKLTFLPSWMTTWEQWKTEHPDTLALDKQGFGSIDVYEINGYYDSPSAGVIGETLRDDRLYTKEFVIGVELAEATVAYPYSVLNEEPVVNDEVAGVPLVVVFDAQAAAGKVFERTVDGQLLTFAPTEEPLRLRDNETGSIWNGFTGQALEGPLAGQQLTQLKSTTVFWFGWKDFHPDTALYGVES